MRPKISISATLLFVLLFTATINFAATVYSDWDINKLQEWDEIIDVSDELNWDTETSPISFNGVLWKTTDNFNGDETKNISGILIPSKELSGTVNLANLFFLENFWCFDNDFVSINATSHFNLTNLLCNDNNLTDLGFSYSSNLEIVRCYNNLISELDLYALPSLKELNCSNNELTAIDVSALTALTNLKLSNNKLPLSELPLPLGAYSTYEYSPQKAVFESDTHYLGFSIDYSSEANIDGEPTVFRWYRNGVLINGASSSVYKPIAAGDYVCEMENATFPELTITTNPISIVIDPNDLDGDGLNDDDVNAIREIRDNHATLSQNWTIGNEENWWGITWNDEFPKRLIGFNVQNMWLIQNIDFTALVELREINIDGNRLQSCDVSGLSKLTTFSCRGNLFTSLSLNDLLFLRDVDCGNNELESLVLDGCERLNELLCDSNSIQSLNLSEMYLLRILDCSYNDFVVLDFTDCISLISLNVQYNKLIELDLDTQPGLNSIVCNNNQIPISKLPIPGSFETYIYRYQSLVLPQSDKEVGDTLRYASEEVVNGVESTYQWVFNNSTELQGETNPTMNTLAYGEGRYHCEIENQIFPDLRVCITQSIRVNRKEQEIIATQSNLSTINIDYCDTIFPAGIELNSGLPLTFEKTTGESVELIDDSVHILSAGHSNYTIVNEGNIQYEPFQGYLYVNVYKADSPIADIENISEYFDVLSIPFDVSNEQNFPMTYTFSNDSIAHIDDGVLYFDKVGQATLEITHEGNENYNADSEYVSIHLLKGSAEILGIEDFEMTYGDDPLTLNGYTLPGIEVNYSTSSTIAQIEGDIFTPIGVGDVLIHVRHDGNENYIAAYKAVYVHIKKAEQQLFLEDINTVMGNPLIELPQVTVQDLVVEYSSLDESVVSVSDNQLLINGVGETTINAVASGNANYNDFSSSFTVVVAENPKEYQEIENFENLSVLMTDHQIELGATATSGLTVEYSASNDIVSLVDNVITINAAGTVEITAIQLGNDDYFPVEKTIVLTIEKASQTLANFESIFVALNEEAILLPENTDQGLALTYELSENEVASISNNEITFLMVGETEVTLSNDGDNIYLPYSLTIRLVVTATPKEEQTISNFEDITCLITDGQLILDATASSGMALEYSASGNAVSITGNIVELKSSGTVEITASQAGNDVYFPAEKTIVLTINKADQFINVIDDIEVDIEQGEISVYPESSSGLEVVMVSNNESIATVDGTSIILLKAGEVNITAMQNGNEFYNPAEAVTFKVVVLDNTAINQLDKTSVRVYPNPVKSTLTVEGDSEIEVDLINLNGKRVISGISTKEKRIMLDVENYNSGVYYIIVKSKGQIHRQQVVILP